MSSSLSPRARANTGPNRERYVSDLPIGTKFRAAGLTYQLLLKTENRCRVQILPTPKKVELPNGRTFWKYRGNKVNIAPSTVVEEVIP